ncbi:hypothetical protein GCM10023205_30520 [Yinghuangia aomiensis]|uniref:Uncharacterized protein n=1 Tax=Yinghuangia aomiensis TaxID=676205 RepID=A0ABP9H8W0_9ACTN
MVDDHEVADRFVVGEDTVGDISHAVIVPLSPRSHHPGEGAGAEAEPGGAGRDYGRPRAR